MKLIDTFVGPRGNKFLVVARYAEVELDLEEFDPRKVGQKDINKIVPVLEIPGGMIYEPREILTYIARLSKKAQLYGVNKWEEIQIDKYLNWTLNVVEPALFDFIDIFWGHRIPSDEEFAMASAKFFSVLGAFEGMQQKKKSKYLIGDEISIADINIVSDLIFVLRSVGDQDFQDRFPKVVQYVETLAQESQFAGIFGKVVACKAALLPSTHKFEESKEALTHPREETKTREVAVPTKKDLVYSFPSTPFNLYEFKTLFVNTSERSEKKKALDTLWAALDKHHTVWKMVYEMVEGEGEVVFKTKNMLTGFLHQLDTLKKDAFAVVGVYGDEPYLEIRGCWIWKDKGIPQAIQDHPSGEWYKFKQLDVKKNPSDRKIFEEYWTSWMAERNQVEGLTVKNVIYFK